MRLSSHFLLACLGCSVAMASIGQTGQSGVVDLRDRTFTAQDVVNALAKPPEPTQTSASARKKRGLAVVPTGGEGPNGMEPSARRALSIQLQFEFDSARLTDDALVKLDAVGSALQSAALQSSRFQVSGHTDAAGKPDYNLGLSRRRAEAVRTYLVARHGIATDRVVATGKGAEELLDPADPRSAVNRRVQFETLD